MMELTILQQKLLDEYYRNERALVVHKKALEDYDFPGNISQKTINGKTRYYLQWRDGKHIRCKYLNKDVVPIMQQEIQIREMHKTSIKRINQDMKDLRKYLGDALINEYREKL